jgi:type IV pilus assembly protein PilC
MDYAYIGYTQDKRVVKGRVTATSEDLAVDMLSNIGLEVVNLKTVTPFMPDLDRLFQGKVKADALATFSRQMALLLESGIGIVQSLELLQGQASDRQLKRVLIEVASDVRRGSSFSVALARHPHVFPTLYHKMVGVAEQTGALEGALRSLADYAERQSATMNKIRSALTYPAIVTVLAIAVGIFMVTTVLPPIINMFSSLHGQLPLITRLLLGGISFMHSYGLYLLAAVVGLVSAIFIYTRTSTGRYYRDMLMLKLPVLGHLALVSELARECRSISLLFKAGLPLPDIMSLTAQSTGNRVIAKALGDVEQDMIRGEGLAGPMKKRWVFLPLMVEMTRVGEETGSLDATLTTVAENYEIESDRRTQAFVAMIEPAMTIAVGGLVGFLAMSIFVPLYSSLGLIK